MRDHTPTAADFERAQAAYLATRKPRRASLLSTAWLQLIEHGGQILRAFVMGLILMGLTALVLHSEADGAEVPDRIVAAVAMVETGATWKDTGNINGTWKRGADGEVSHWQLTDAVLIDLRLSSSQKRKVASCPVYAESVFRLWYSRLLTRTGSHAAALAAYHRGLGGAHRRDARDYARRVLNIAETL